MFPNHLYKIRDLSGKIDEFEAGKCSLYAMASWRLLVVCNLNYILNRRSALKNADFTVHVCINLSCKGYLLEMLTFICVYFSL